MAEIRCINMISEHVNPSYGVKITDFCLKSGKTGTEIVTTTLNTNSQKVKTILRNAAGEIEKVTEDEDGRHVEYVSAYPAFRQGVLQYVYGQEWYLPHESLKNLSKY